MRQRGQLIRIKEPVGDKITLAQLLLSIQRKRVITKSQALNVLLDDFLNNYQANNQE